MNDANNNLNDKDIIILELSMGQLGIISLKINQLRELVRWNCCIANDELELVRIRVHGEFLSRESHGQDVTNNVDDLKGA